MYRSMKIKNIRIKRADPEQVEYLCQCNAVRAGTHSVTLIPFESGLYFIADAWNRQHKAEGAQEVRKIRSFIADKPKLHRRKPHPWNVHRSLKKEYITNKITTDTGIMDFIPKIENTVTPSCKKMPSLVDLQVACCMDEIELEEDFSEVDEQHVPNKFSSDSSIFAFPQSCGYGTGSDTVNRFSYCVQ